MADRTMIDIALDEKALVAGAEAVLELWRKQGLENCSAFKMAREAIRAYLRASPSQVAPQPQAGEPVAMQYRYRHRNPKAIWSEWGDHKAALSSYSDWEEEGRPLYASPQPANPAQVTDAMVEHMVLRFLRWKLPDDFNPDGGIAFDPIINMGTESQSRREPVGTNLLDYRQAKAMVQHMLDGLAAIGAGGQAVAVKALENAWTDFLDANPDDLTSPEDLPDHALMTCAQFVECALSALSQLHHADERVVEALRADVGELLRMIDKVQSRPSVVGIYGIYHPNSPMAQQVEKVRAALAKEGRLMVDAKRNPYPEKIWLDGPIVLLDPQSVKGAQHYLRADIAERQIAELRAKEETWHKLYQQALVRENAVTAERDSFAAENARLRALPLKDEVERALRKAHDETMSEAGAALLDKSVDGRIKANWLGGKANGLATALDILSRLRAGEQEGCE